MYTVKLTKNASKDKIKLKEAKLDKKAKVLLEVLISNPFKNPPSYEKLVGDLKGYYSRRINAQHRIVYRVDEINKIVIVHSMWTHYE